MRSVQNGSEAACWASEHTGQDLGRHEATLYVYAAVTEKVRSGREVKAKGLNLHFHTWPLQLTHLKCVLERGSLL